MGVSVIFTKFLIVEVLRGFGSDLFITNVTSTKDLEKDILLESSIIVKVRKRGYLPSIT
jgi:hypothetical protein